MFAERRIVSQSTREPRELTRAEARAAVSQNDDLFCMSAVVRPIQDTMEAWHASPGAMLLHHDRVDSSTDLRRFAQDSVD